MKASRLATVSMMALLILAGNADASSTESFGFWNQDLAQGRFGSPDSGTQPFRWWLEGQARVFDNLDRINQALARAALGYAISDKVTFWLGYSWNPTRIPGKPQVDEHDLFPALTYTSATEYGTFSGRSMLDVRFTNTGPDTGYRYRQLIRFVHPFAFEPRLSLVGWDEAFLNVNSTRWGARSGLDQNRAFGGVGWQFNNNFRTELGYFNWFLNTRPGTDTVRHMLAVNFLLNF